MRSNEITSHPRSHFNSKNFAISSYFEFSMTCTIIDMQGSKCLQGLFFYFLLNFCRKVTGLMMFEFNEIGFFSSDLIRDGQYIMLSLPGDTLDTYFRP